MFATAFLDLPSLQQAGGTVTLPGSKSISNRVLLLSALCEGSTWVHDLLDSDDTRVMLAALRQLGCGVEPKPGTNSVCITGLGQRTSNGPSAGLKKPTEAIEFFMGNAGTAMRPLTAALAVMGGDFTLKGVPRMHERPIGDLVDALRLLGCHIDYLGNEGYPPLRVLSPLLQLDKPIQVRGDVSSQFLTALLMSLPLAAQKDIVIEVVGELISKPYIEITLNLLARYGINVKRDAWQRFTIPAGSHYTSPGQIHVEADASSASYFIALGALAATDKAVRIQGVGASSIQGDIRFMEAAAQMGANIESGPNWLEIRRGAWPLKAIDFGRDGLVCRRPHHPAQHCQLARERNRSPCGHGQRIAQVGRAGRRRPRLVAHLPSANRPVESCQHSHLRRSPCGHVFLFGCLQCRPTSRAD
jgi:3-phosphoshikimate 1-carboxyvinyltransferase